MRELNYQDNILVARQSIWMVSLYKNKFIRLGDNDEKHRKCHKFNDCVLCWRRETN